MVELPDMYCEGNKGDNFSERVGLFMFHPLQLLAKGANY
jgi:hypothetical protein